jgi:hypothetical protein
VLHRGNQPSSVSSLRTFKRHHPRTTTSSSSSSSLVPRSPASWPAPGAPRGRSGGAPGRQGRGDDLWLDGGLPPGQGVIVPVYVTFRRFERPSHAERSQAPVSVPSRLRMSHTQGYSPGRDCRRAGKALLFFGFPVIVVREPGPARSRPPSLLDRVREALLAHHYSHRTEDTDVAGIRRYILFHRKRHPADMAAPGARRRCRARLDVHPGD